MAEEADELLVRIKGDASGAVRAIEEVEGAEKGLEESSTKSNRKVQDETDKTSKKIKGLGEESKKTSKTVESDFEKMTGSSKTAAAAFERNFSRSKTSAEAFDKTIRELKQQSKTLGDLYNKTGDEKFLVRMKQADKDAKALSKSAQELAGVLGKEVPKASGEAESSMGTLVPVVSSLVAAFSPLIGGAIAGGILALVGGGGIAAGIAGQLHSPLVTSAVDQFGADLQNRFDEATAAFAPELRDTLAAIDRNTAPFWDDLKAGLTDLAPYLKIVGDGFARFMNVLGPGLEEAFKGAEPVLTLIAEELPLLADSITTFFTQLSEGGAGAAEAIAYVFQGVETAIVALGYLLHFLSWVTDKVTNAIIKILDAMSHLPNALGGDKFKLAADNLRSMQSDAQTASTNMRDLGGAFDTVNDSIQEQYKDLLLLNTAWDDATDKTMGYYNAQLKAIEAEQAFSKTLKTTKHDWDMTHEAGQKNWHGLLDTIQAEKDKYDADIKIHGVTLQNTLAYQKSIEKLLAQAQAAGLSKDKIDELRQQFLALGQILDKLQGRKVTFTVQGNIVGALPGGRSSVASVLASSGVHRFAASGVARDIPHFDLTGVYAGRPGGVYRFAEASTVEEALIGRNTDKGRALGALRQAASWHDAVVVTNNASSATYSHTAVSVRGGGGSPTMLHADIYMDSKRVATAIVPVVQRINNRSATSVYGGP